MPKKGISNQKQKEWTSPLNSPYSNQCSYQISVSTDNFDFLDQICPKRVFPIKNKKNKHYHWILHVGIRLRTKFQLKVTFLIFWTKFSQKGHFWPKTKKLNITIEFCMFELVYVPNFSLKWEFWCFGQNLPKKGISDQKQKKWTSPLNSACSN